MLVISSREFRDKQAEYFDRVDNGEQIIVQRGKDKAYRLTPVTENDVLISKEYILEPDDDLARAISFDEFRESAINHIRELYRQKRK
ncbi:type II toxin-antitoxin system prevent-host-death family antitoxin [Bacteroides sp. 519]|uniref:type II toxin-antitoxin system prevent-host-death family antitoxin n=1 Tax=Bacteroides sp. 519 TaxID=2302937 RepID=UPI0013D7A337|nr:type II toxin-antitoxin system prevent-host-death family antitoxin [Bacteroides sp. 519]NDV58494.1 type II toxin-antitoxin system prevent-host-death family antitoxin [Bacteroides sp. 519]